MGFNRKNNWLGGKNEKIPLKTRAVRYFLLLIAVISFCYPTLAHAKVDLYWPSAMRPQAWIPLYGNILAPSLTDNSFSGNTFTINDSLTTDAATFFSAAAGWSFVYISSGTSSHVFTENIMDNTLRMEGTTTQHAKGEYIYGGLSYSHTELIDASAYSGSVSGNSVKLNYVDVNNIAGGVSEANTDTIYETIAVAGNVTKNRVSVINSEINGEISGASSKASGQKAISGNVLENTAYLSNVSFGQNTALYGGISTANAKNNAKTGDVFNNTLILHNTTNNSQIITSTGGKVYSEADNASIGSVSGNKVFIKNSKINSARGGVMESKEFTHAQLGNLTHNQVVIQNSEISTDIYGAYLSIIGKSGSDAAVVLGDIFDNKITLENVTGSAGKIYAANIEFSNATPPLMGNIKNNSITLKGTNTLNNAWLAGSTGSIPLSNIDNTLDVYGTNHTFNNVSNFQIYNFYLDENNKNATLLNLVNRAELLIDNGNTYLTAIVQNPLLKAGDTFTLIKAQTALLSNESLILQVADYEYLLDYIGSFVKDDHTITFTIEGLEANPKTKNILEASVASASMLNSGADMVSGSVMDNAYSATLSTNKAAAFAGVSGGFIRSHSGSYVDTTSGSFAVGIGKRLFNNSLMLGGFFESGLGSYKAYNEVRGTTMSGKGTMHYFGGGVLARYDWQNVQGLYTDFSARIGSVSTDYKTNDLVKSTGENARYDESNVYYGAHIALGYGYNIDEAFTLDVFGKYHFGAQASQTIKVLSDPLKFSGIYSHRLQAGAKLEYAHSSTFLSYAGLSAEYETNGKVKATFNGIKLPSPKMQGITAIGELGLVYNPTKNISLDFALQGYLGKREGISGNIQVKFEF